MPSAPEFRGRDIALAVALCVLSLGSHMLAPTALSRRQQPTISPTSARLIERHQGHRETTRAINARVALPAVHNKRMFCCRQEEM